MLMGTVVEITVMATDQKRADRDLAAAFAEMERLDELLGSHGQRGEIWRLNETGYPDGAEVSEEVFGLLLRARAKGMETGGAFDCTVGSLMRLWSFETGGRVPDPAAIKEELKRVGWDKLAFDEKSRRITFLRPGVRLDLGSIGKSYAVDRAYELLRTRGVTAGLVNAGGDIRAWGRKPPDNAPWKIGIQHPRRPDALLGTLTLTDQAVVTSGDYERNFVVDGKLYHHILDPATGYPSQGLESVTMVAGTAEAACSTGLMAMGPVKARRFLAEHSGSEGVMVDAAGSVFVTPGLADAWRPAD
jgi:thiamine biosynthesis lipoprotein